MKLRPEYITQNWGIYREIFTIVKALHVTDYLSKQ